MKILKISSCLCGAFALALSPLMAVNSVSAETCKDVEFIFAPGSGAVPGKGDVEYWEDSFRTVLADSSLSYDFYELGTREYDGARYLDVPVGVQSSEAVVSSLSAPLSALRLGIFNESVDLGARELAGRVRVISASCPNTKFVIGGYSQGAIVIDRSLNKIDPEQLVYAATFGDPNLYLPEGKGLFPAACRGENLSSYRRYAPNCRAYKGMIGASIPYEPSNLAGKVGLWCTERDLFCSMKFDLTDITRDHTSYMSNGLYLDAANYIKNQLTIAFPDKFAEPGEPAQKRNLAILIDSTGSMGEVIERFKATALNLAEETINHGGQVALFEYRDLAEEYEPRLRMDFGTSLEDFKRALNQIETYGGKDDPESALSASLHVMNTLKWQKDATKSLVLLTDADYHSPDLDGVTLPQVILRSLEIDPVNIYAVTTDETVAAAYEPLTSATGGQTFVLDATSNAISLPIASAVLTRPEVFLPLEEYQGVKGEEFQFTVNGSHDIVKYDWDLDGDGTFETTTASPSIKKTYAGAFDGYIQVRAHGENGTFSTASAHVKVYNSASEVQTPTLADVGFELNGDRATVHYQLAGGAKAVLVTLDGLVLGLTMETSFTLSNLSDAAEVTLVPLNDSTRGEAVVLNLSTDSGFGGGTLILAPNAGKR